MLALSIRQPYAELILRGIKTIEYRSRATKIIGRRFHIYAARAKAALPVWSGDLEVAAPPEWMIELARQVRMIPADEELPTGVIVGSAVIEKCGVVDPDELLVDRPPRRSSPPSNSNHRPATPIYAWHLTDIQRARTLRKPGNQPQPVWFRAF
jgi:hypothetical protein